MSHVGLLHTAASGQLCVSHVKVEVLTGAQEPADDRVKDEHAPGTSSESARQRTRTGSLSDVKYEEILPRASSPSKYSEDAASLR